MNKHHWTHIFIHNPIWAFVLSTLILLIGARSLLIMQVRKFPAIQLGVITVQAIYPGAAASLMQASVTTPLQRSIAQADGIDYLTAVTRDGFTQIQAHLKVDYNTDKAFTDILAEVQSVKSLLPPDLNDPILSKGTGTTIALMYVAYTCNEQSNVTSSQIYNYLNTVIRPQLLTIDGVGAINILGAQPPAMRLWLDFDKMQEFQISFKDISDALTNENFSLPAGNIRSTLSQQALILQTRGSTPEDFKNIPLRVIDGQLLTLGAVATIELGAENYDSIVTFNDRDGVFLSVDTLPTANALTVIAQVRDRLLKLQPALPTQLQQKIVYDATHFINESITEVIKTLIEAATIVVLVMYAFLRSVRAVIIPLVTIPLSIVGVGTFMYFLGFSINLLTLLAIILAIGLVVDDAIIVVENCFKHLEEGLSPLEAAKKSIADIANPLIIMTLILAIAYLPMAFLGGLTGGLFKEFAFTLSTSVLISGIIALTLSPVMCAFLLRQEDAACEPHWLRSLTRSYEERLQSFFSYKKSVVFFSISTFILVFLLGSTLSKELAPKEDQGFALVTYSSPESATLDYTVERSLQVRQHLKSFEEEQDYFLINGAGTVTTGFGGFIAKPWNQRQRTLESLEGEFREKFGKIVGIEAFSFTPHALPGADGLPFQFVLFGPFNFETLYNKAMIVCEKLRESGYFAFLTTDIKINKPIFEVSFNRERLTLNGLHTLNFGQGILYSLAEAKNSRFNYDGQELDVIVQSPNRSLAQFLQKLPVDRQHATPMMLDDIAQLTLKVEPNERHQFNQLNAITLQGMLFPLFTLGDTLKIVDKLKTELAQEGYFSDYTGPTRAYVQESNQLLKTGFFALVISYLMLCALFHNFMDPLIILITVPLALSGALACMHVSSFIGFAPTMKQYNVTLNIYTELGLLTLMGLITKHGILIVQVANKMKDLGLSAEEAAFKAAVKRFRPILMTTAAMIIGVAPLLFAQGAGAVSRFHLGYVIATGMGLGTLFTLFIIPVIYSMLTSNKITLHQKELS